MTDFHAGATVLCPTCRVRTFVQDQPWKLVCVTCYLVRKGKTTGIAMPTATAAPIPADMLRRLVQLCHPDRHGNSEAALRVLAKACAKSLEVYTVDMVATESMNPLFLNGGAVL